jgi:molybdopterin-binding protein
MLGLASGQVRSSEQRQPLPIQGEQMKLSARNQIPAQVKAINAGDAIANVELDAGGIRLVASITVEAVRELGLTEGAQVTAIIKASDVIVATA